MHVEVHTEQGAFVATLIDGSFYGPDGRLERVLHHRMRSSTGVLFESEDLHAYGPSGAIEKISTRTPETEDFATRDFTYHPDGSLKRAQYQRTIHPLSTFEEFDLAGRLVASGESTNGSVTEVTHRFDADGTLLSTVTTYSSNEIGTEAREDFSYGADGRLDARTLTVTGHDHSGAVERLERWTSSYGEGFRQEDHDQDGDGTVDGTARTTLDGRGRPVEEILTGTSQLTDVVRITHEYGCPSR